MDPSSTHRPIAVWYDGSEVAGAALDWAVDEARLRGAPLRVVVAVPVVTAPSALTGTQGTVRDDLGRRLADEATTRIRGIAPEVDVETDVRVGSAAGALVNTSETSEMVVVSRGDTLALGEVVTGSTSVKVIAHAECPVAVIDGPRPRREPGGVVVGTDMSTWSEAALRFAFAEAAIRQAPLTVVHAWWHDVMQPHGVPSDAQTAETQRRQEDSVAAETADWARKYPEVDVRTVVTQSLPVDAILAPADGADMIVVGSRGLGGFAGLVLGSVSQALLHRNRPCPLVVVHPHR